MILEVKFEDDPLQNKTPKNFAKVPEIACGRKPFITMLFTRFHFKGEKVERQSSLFSQKTKLIFNDIPFLHPRKTKSSSSVIETESLVICFQGVQNGRNWPGIG